MENVTITTENTHSNDRNDKFNLCSQAAYVRWEKEQVAVVLKVMNGMGDHFVLQEPYNMHTLEKSINIGFI